MLVHVWALITIQLRLYQIYHENLAAVSGDLMVLEVVILDITCSDVFSAYSAQETQLGNQDFNFIIAEAWHIFESYSPSRLDVSKVTNSCS